MAWPFTFDILMKVLWTGDIDADSDTIKAALLTSSVPSRVTQWASSTAYTTGDIVRPLASRNYRRYVATNSGLSDSSEPTWTTVVGDQITDNTIVWKEYGSDIADNLFFGDNVSQWATSTTYAAGEYVVPTSANGRIYICTVPGLSHGVTEPAWPTTIEGTVVDNTVTWQEVAIDLSYYETSGTGYTAGGVAITSQAADYSGAKGWIDSDNITFSSITATFMWCVIYKVAAPGYLISNYRLDTTDVTVNASDFVVTLGANGIASVRHRNEQFES
jgi:hypothetical protein